MSTEYVRLLMYFILTIGLILIGVLLVSFIELQRGNNLIQEAYVKLNQTSAAINQTQLFLESTKHEDEARDNQSQFEMQGRSNQTKTILNGTQDYLENHHQGLLDYIDRTNNTTNKIIDNILDISNQHKQVAKDHDLIQNEVRNVTNENRDMLERYGENSIVKFDLIIDRIEKIESNIENITNEFSKLIGNQVKYSKK